MSDCEDLKKIDEIIKNHKVEAEDADEYAEFIDYSDGNEVDDTNEFDDYEIPDFPKSDISQFHNYTATEILTDDEKRVIESCPNPDLKQLLFLNRNKNIQLMQLYKKIKDLLEECQNNILLKEEFIREHRDTKRVCNKVWRLGIPYFKTKDDFPCPRNEDIIRKHNNGELLFYELSPSNKWLEKDMNRLLKGIAFHYKKGMELELEKQIKPLDKELSKGPRDPEKKALLQTLRNKLDRIKNTDSDVYPPLGCDKYLNWKRIAEQFLKDRYSSQDCKIFWNTYLHPDINKGAWKEEEDSRLKELTSEYNCQNWDLIANELGNNRTGFIACVHYFCKVNPPRQGRFTDAEDKLLLKIVDQYRQGEYIPWTKVAHHFKERTRGQLFYRYKYFLSCRKGKARGKFSEAEDILILILVDRFGTKFSKCGPYFPNRSVVQIKARYSSNLKIPVKKGSFTVEEDQRILQYVKENGITSWEPLVKELNRSGGQIRQRYKTLTAFVNVFPDADLAAAPRRRYNGLAFNAEADFLRCMADKFKNCEEIPTLQDIEKLLLKNPIPQPEPIPRGKSNHRGLRLRRGRESKEQPVQNKAEAGENVENLAENTDKNTIPNKCILKVKKDKSSLLSSKPEENSDSDDMFQDMNLTTDNLLTEFFSNSLKLTFEQSVSQQHIQKAASSVRAVLSILQVALHIPKNFQVNSLLDTIDLDILKMLTASIPVNGDGHYVINRSGLHIEQIIPPNLNTIVGMRSLLIKNQIYKSKQSKRAYIFENFRTECKEKQVTWCINNHLSNQSMNTRQELLSERELFFKRFVSLFKFPAIMTLQSPSEKLEATFKEWSAEHTPIMRTYKKKSRPLVSKSNIRAEYVFIKQQPQDDYCEVKTDAAEVDGHGNKIGASEETPLNSLVPKKSTEFLTVKSTSDLESDLSIVERLKRKIKDAICQLDESPPAKKFYPNTFERGWIQSYSSQPPNPPVASRTVSAASKNIRSAPANKTLTQKETNTGKNTKNDKVNTRTYTPKSKEKTKLTLVSATINKAISQDQSVTKAVSNNNLMMIKSENCKNVYPRESESRSSFNLDKGELVLDNSSPYDNKSESSIAISQDLLDLNVLNAVLKKEKHTAEESFDF